MRESTRTTFSTALVNLDTNKAVAGWKEDTFSSIDLTPGKELVFTESELTAEISRLEVEYVSQEYARNRKAEYDALNQFEMQYDDKKNSTTTWDDAIEAIKKKYPKG